MFRLALLLPLVVLSFAPAQSAADKKATVDYIHSLQDKRGGYRLDATADGPTLRGTSAALRALKYFGGTPKNALENKLFVALCKDKSGGYANVPEGKPDPVLTAVGLMASVETGILTKDTDKAGASIAFLEANAKEFEQIRMAAAGLEAIGQKSKKNDEWLKLLGSMQNDDGTFGKDSARARDTGSAAACVLRLGGKLKNPEALVKALDSDQREDGGFGKAEAKISDLETTYRVMRTYHMLGKQPARAADLRGFVAKCRNTDGGYGVTPGAASTIGSTYFAGIILHWLDSK